MKKTHFLLAILTLPIMMFSFVGHGQTKTVYHVAPEKSRLNWICGNHNGYIDIHEGTLSMVNGEITGGSFTIAMDSITTLDIEYELMRETLNNLLKSDHYFHSQKYPLSKYEITKSHRIEGNKHCITGNLRIKDQEHPVTFHAEVKVENGQLNAGSEKFFIDRTEWGITTSSEKYVKNKDSFTFADEIYFVVHLVANKK